MRLVWAESAEADLYSIADYYQTVDPAMPDEILGRIIGAPLILLEQPRLGMPTLAGIRKWSVRHTPYILLYRILSDAIEVARVVHVASDWREP